MKRNLVNALIGDVEINETEVVFTQEDRYIHGKGMTLFIINIVEPLQFSSYITRRYTSILQQLTQLSDDDPFIILKATNYSRGAINHNNYCRVREIKALIQQNVYTPISSTVLNMVGEKLNVYSYIVGETTIPEIFCMDFDFASIILRRTEEELLRNNFTNRNSNGHIKSHRALIELRVKCSKVLILPIIMFQNFLLIVMLPRRERVYVLGCVNLDTINFNEVLRKLVAYYNTIIGKSAKRFEEWTVYIDGQDPTKHRLNPDGPFYSNCGIFIICYMLRIGLHKNIDEIVSVFERNEYYSLFDDINVDIILHKKKLITVFLNDFEQFI